MKNCCSGVKPSSVGAGCCLLRLLEGQVGDLGACEIADRFAEHQLAVVVDAGLDEVVLELVDDALRPRAGSACQIVGRPPVVAAGPARRIARPDRRSRG